MAVYVDVLVAVNFMVDYLLLKTAAIFCGYAPRRWRIISGAALGAVSSLIIFFPPETAVTEFFYRISVSVLVCASAFCPCKIKTFAKVCFGFLTSSFIFSGAVLLWQITAHPMGVISCAGAIYLDIAAPALIICSVVGYAAACLLSRMMSWVMPQQSLCEITVINNGSVATVTALIDSGSSLVEPFSNCPVIVCERTALGDTVPLAIEYFLIGKEPAEGIRLIPYKTLDSSGLLAAFMPEKLLIKTDGCKKNSVDNCYIAVIREFSEQDYKAVCNPKIFSNKKAGDDLHVSYSRN